MAVVGTGSPVATPSIGVVHQITTYLAGVAILITDVSTSTIAILAALGPTHTQRRDTGTSSRTTIAASTDGLAISGRPRGDTAVIRLAVLGRIAFRTDDARGQTLAGRVVAHIELPAIARRC